jgi:hypothetical protein
MLQVRLLARGIETVLGDAASDAELFLTTHLETRCAARPPACLPACLPFTHTPPI